MNHLTVRKYARNLLASAIGLSIASSAMAELEEVVVTASLRSESLQEVSMSIAAISGDRLERMGDADFTDIATSIPSVSFRSAGPGRTKLNIRGISAATGVASTVSFYIDEMPVTTISSGSSTSFAQAIVDPKMFDLARVEVLRGPQGTLYGSSSMGGTVRLITNKPVIGEFEGKVAAEVSTTEEGGFNYSTKGMVNAPLGEKAALRVVASYTDNDGYFDRVSSTTGETFAEDVNTEETTSIRATLRFNISDNAYIQPSIFTQTTDMDGKPNFDGPIYDYEQLSPFDAPEPFEDEFTMANLTYGHDFEMFTLMASYSVMDREFSNVEDISDGFAIIGINPPPQAGFSDEEVELDDSTLEIRLSSNSDSALSWIVGLYQKDAESDSGYRMDRGWNASGATANGLANTQKYQKYEETAFFGEVTYSFTEKLDVTVGLRSLDYDYTFLEENWGFAFNGDQGRDMANVRDEKLSDDEMNSKLTVTYHLNEDAQIYGTLSDGTRPGGVNRVIPRSTDPTDPIPFACNNDLIALGVSDPDIYEGDKVENTEFGWKTMINENIRFNGAVYRVKWEDIQQVVTTSSTCGNNFATNVGEAESTGIELELTAAISENLTLNAGFGYIDAEFKDDVPEASIEGGDKFADVPELSYSVALDYVMPLQNGEAFFIGSYNYVDETLELPGQAGDDLTGAGIDSGNVRDDYGILDLRAGYSSQDGWEAVVFVDNATDEEAIYGFNDAIAFTFPNTDPTVRNRPRTIGASISYEF
ncbi:MAG: outer membrane receptor protein involved in Fe transport [Oceanicoccus sp.]|jgi:outer membrane receptor protein involved in Fe transport